MDGAPVSCGYKDAIEDFDEAISKHPECRACLLQPRCGEAKIERN